jgi:hypothetical protein
VACGHRWCLLVTRSVREGASVHGQASYSTLDMIGSSDRANDMVDGGLCNGALLWRFLAYASGYWFRWPLAIGGSGFIDSILRVGSGAFDPALRVHTE